MGENLSVRKVLRYGAVFLIFAAAACFLVLRGTDMRTVWEALADTSIPFLIAGILLAEVFHLSEGINLRILLGSFGNSVTFWQGMKYAYIGFFFSSITPSSTGGQPAQLYAMKKDGIEIAHGTLALIGELASFQIAVCFMEIMAMAAIIQGKVSPSGELLVLAVLGFLLNLLFITGLLSVMFSRRLKDRLLRLLHGAIARLPVKNKEKWQEKLEEAFRDFQACADLIRRKPRVMAKALLVSICQVICWFSIPYMVCLAMGETAAYPQVFLLQTVLFMTTALLPFPGAAGISEYAFVRLFSGVFTKNPMAAATLVNRGISFYCLLAISGAMMVFLWKYKGTRKMSKFVQEIFLQSPCAYINIKLDSGERMKHSEQGESKIYFSAFHNNPNSCEQ